MKKGLNFTKEKLEELYWDKKLSLSEIAKMFDCTALNILYWLKKFNIKRRAAYVKKVNIETKVLEELYWKKNLSTSQIAEKFGVNSRTIRKKLVKQGIGTKTVSEALTKKFKKPFSGDLSEKAYFLGMRAGDFYAKWMKKSIRIQTSTTHPAQIEFTKRAFEKYGETRIYLSKNKERQQNEWFIYVDLHPSFEFLLQKPDEIESEILENKEAFYKFLSAYADCEANWNIARSHKEAVRFVFRIRSQDKKILEQIKETLKKANYSPLLNLEKKKGSKSPYRKLKKAVYNLTINKKAEIVRFIKKLLSLSKHDEKITKMEFILKNQNRKWKDIELEWKILRKEIKRSILKNYSEKNRKKEQRNYSHQLNQNVN